jgi:hypothetical protein
VRIKAGKVLVKIPRRSSKSEILQEVYQELLNCLKLVTLQTPVVSEIDGVVSLEKLKEVTVRLS